MLGFYASMQKINLNIYLIILVFEPAAVRHHGCAIQASWT